MFREFEEKIKAIIEGKRLKFTRIAVKSMRLSRLAIMFQEI